MISNKRGSVKEIPIGRKRDHIYEAMDNMRLVMVKGLGYVLVSKNQNDPEMFRRMGNVIAEAIEEEARASVS
jgi:hypothetical protein